MERPRSSSSTRTQPASPTDEGPVEPANDLDRWILSRLSATVAEVGERLESFDATTAGREIQDLVEDLSNWYVRRSRRRFWDGDESAFAVLRHVLLTTARLLAPFCPFMADHIHTTLDPNGEPSVHLCDWPEASGRDQALETAMAAAREAVRLGLAARGQAKIKVRQPLRAAVVVATAEERGAIEGLADIVREELNVKELRFADAADDLGGSRSSPTTGRWGRASARTCHSPRRRSRRLDPGHVAEALRSGEPVHVNVGGREHPLAADDLAVAMKPLDGYQLEREGSHAVALELEIDEELELEGLAREIVHALQAARKQAGLEVTDRVVVGLRGDEQLMKAARAHAKYIEREVLASGLEVGAVAANHVERDLDGHALELSVECA